MDELYERKTKLNKSHTSNYMRILKQLAGKVDVILI